MAETGASSQIKLAPLPVPAVSPSLPRIRKTRPSKPGVSAAVLVPLFYAALLYLAGIVLAHHRYLRPSLLLLGLVPLVLVAVFAMAKVPRLTWLPLAVIWLILGAWSVETEPQPAPDPAITQLSDGLLRTIEGTVTDAGPLRASEIEDQDFDAPQSFSDPLSLSSGPPVQAGASEQIQQVDLQLTAAEIVNDDSDTLNSIPARAKLRLNIQWSTGLAQPGQTQSGQAQSGQAQFSEIQCGQRLDAVVRILPSETFHDPGAWDRAAYLESQQISATASVNANKRDGREPRLVLFAEPHARSFACFLNRWRNSASIRIQTLPGLTRKLPRPFRATPEDAAMLTALLTGDRTYLTRGLRVGFERTGSFHLIVVSGLHLAILAGCVFALARRLRLPPVAATAITLAVSLAYALFTGFAIPAQRSFWMIALYLIGRLLYRNRSPLNVIGFATLCLAAASPRSIFDASLQMTLLSVAAIAGIAMPLLERTLHVRIKATKDLQLISLDTKLPPKIAQFRVTLRLLARHLEPACNRRIAWQFFPFLLRSALRFGELLFVTLIVELALALPMAIYFHRITVYALPVNLCILPLLGLLVPTAMLLLLVLSIWPAAASFLAIGPAAACLALLHFSVFIVRKLGEFALGGLRIPDPTAFQIAAALVLFVFALQLARSRYRCISFAALILMATATLWPRPIDHPANALLFEAIDVGQGDSLLLIAPDGKTVLIDGGGLGIQTPTLRPNHSEFDVGEEVVSAALWSRGIRHLDAVALTHAHHDHMGGLPAILRNFHPSELWIGNNPPVPAYLELIQQARSAGSRVRPLHAGETVSLGAIQLRVLAPASDYRPGPRPTNNDSLVLQARYGATSVLLEGDAEAAEENSILTRANQTQSGLQSTVLKVGHHGSLTSTRPAFLEQVAPAWAVISCGRRNRFGHPRAEILAELQAAHTRTYRTDLDGAACFLLDGQSVTPQPLCGKVP